MLYAFICHDKPGALEIRMANRPAHLAWLEATPGVYLAGPLLDAEDKPCGSILMVEHPDLAAAEAWGETDPYVKAGLFAAVEVKAWRKVIGA